MLESIIWTGIILAGTAAYGVLNGGFKETEQKKSSNKDSKENHYKETYDYFSKLPLEEQHKYINDNLDLRYYKDELTYDTKEATARQVARRADKLEKTFNNRFKAY